MQGNELRRLIELAFEYVAAETKVQAEPIRYQAAILAQEAIVLNIWLDLVDYYMEEWNRSRAHKTPMSRASALQFFATRQAEVQSVQSEN